MPELLGDIEEWFRGDNYPLILTIKNKSTKLPVDLDGYTFVLTVDTLKDPKDALTKVFSVDGVLDPDPTTGKVSFTPTVLNTSIAPATYFYDIQMTDDQGHNRTIAKYKWKIVQDITK